MRGLLLGLTSAITLSVLKPLLGTVGMLLSLVTAVVILAGTVGILRSLARSVSSLVGAEHESAVRAKARVGAAFRTGMTGLLFGCLLAGVDRFGPEEGYLVAGIGRITSQYAAAVPVVDADAQNSPGTSIPAPDPFDEKPWVGADFVLANPGHYAVGVKQLGPPEIPVYRVTAKATDKQAELAMGVAWDLRRPVVGNDPALTRRVYAASEVGEKIDVRISQEILSLRQPRAFTPGDVPLLSFHDLRNRKPRVGYLLKRTGAGIEFCDLLPVRLDRTTAGRTDVGRREIPFRVEVIPHELVQPGTERLDISETELKETVDFLDLCLSRVLQKLETKQYDFVHVYVDQVIADVNGFNGGPNSGQGNGLTELKGRLSDRQKIVDADIQRTYEDKGRPRQVVDVLVRKLLEAQREQKDENARSSRFEKLGAEIATLGDEIARLRSLIDQENRLTSEIRSKLTRSGVPLIERSERAKELLRGKVGETWLRPDSKEAVSTQIVGASHLLITDIRSPERRGRYQLSMRLIEVSSGTILWEDQGDRFDPTTQALEMAAPNYLLNTGEMVLLDFGGDLRPEPPRPLSSLSGGLPVRLHGVRLTRVTPEQTEKERKEAAAHRPAPVRVRGRTPVRGVVDAGPPEGVHTRLGYLERLETPEGPVEGFRDLFGSSVQRIDRMEIGGSGAKPAFLSPSAVRRTPVSSNAEVPEAHQMRYLVWRLARAIMPLAGRVSEANGTLVHMTLGRDDKVSVGDRLTVLRPSQSTSADPANPVSVLPVELILREVHERSSSAFLAGLEDAGTESAAAPPRVTPVRGDIVYRKLTRPVAIAVLDPLVDVTSLPPEVARQFRGGEVATMMNHTGKRLAALIQSGLLEQKVHVVDRENLEKVVGEQRLADLDPNKVVEIGKLTGATHIVLGTISPSPEMNGRAPASLRIVEVESGVVADRVPFVFTLAQMQNWKP